MEVTVGEDVIDIKIMIIEMTIEIEGDKTLGQTPGMTEMMIGIEIGQDKEVGHQGEMITESMIVQM